MIIMKFITYGVLGRQIDLAKIHFYKIYQKIYVQLIQYGATWMSFTCIFIKKINLRRHHTYVQKKYKINDM